MQARVGRRGWVAHTGAAGGGGGHGQRVAALQHEWFGAARSQRWQCSGSAAPDAAVFAQLHCHHFSVNDG